MKNPHSPTKEWLDSIAGPGGYRESEEGDSGTHVLQRDGVEYEVEVTNLGKDPDLINDEFDEGDEVVVVDVSDGVSWGARWRAEVAAADSGEVKIVPIGDYGFGTWCPNEAVEHTTSPNRGGCWICRSDEGEMELDTEYDAYVHPSCLDERGYETLHEYEKDR